MLSSAIFNQSKNLSMANAIQCDFQQSQNLLMENAIQCDFQPKSKCVHGKCHSVRFPTKVKICPEYLYDTSIEKIL